MADLQIAPPLLKTKLHIPQRRPDIVPRLLLIKQLNERVQRKLTLITAPAGYGKTSLASEWIHSLQLETTSNTQITWLSLEEADSEPIRFVTYLIAALQQGAPEIGVDTLSLFEMAQPPPINTVLNELINEIAGLDFPILLVLDDYHVISHPEIHDALRYLVEHQPHQIHLVMTSREDPPLPLSRLRARGEMAEIRMHDLRFFVGRSDAVFLSGYETESGIRRDQPVRSADGRMDCRIATGRICVEKNCPIITLLWTPSAAATAMCWITLPMKSSTVKMKTCASFWCKRPF